MKIVYFSPDMRSYPAASYQADVASELARQHEVFFYGPGYPNYAVADTLADVLAKAPWRPDVLGVGHAWLLDKPNGPINTHAAVRLRDTTVPKFLILNKEYVRLADKLQYARDEQFDLVLTHHHEVKAYHAATGLRFVFWPFAYDHRTFQPGRGERDIDLFFSGILRNRGHPETQSDSRIKIQDRFFVTLGLLKLFRRRRHADRRLIWNAYSGFKSIDAIDRVLGRYRRIPDGQYQSVFGRSKIALCTLSPLDLVSPRFFEAMGSGALVLCPRSERYVELFEEEKHCVFFEPTLNLFDWQIDAILDDTPFREGVTARAEAHVRENHTWERRIHQLTELLGQRVSSAGGPPN